jgi:hypothetical protein
MIENRPDLVEKLHREAVARYWEQNQKGRGLVEQAHQEAAERYQAEKIRLDELIGQLHREAAAQAGQTSPTPLPGPTVRCTELPEATPGSPLYREWNTYRREVGRLVAEGSEGRYVLIKDEQIVGLWDTHDAAMTAGYQRFPGQAFLVHQIQERERVLRCVSIYQWPNLRFPSRQAS